MTRIEIVLYITEWLKDEYALNESDRTVLEAILKDYKKLEKIYFEYNWYKSAIFNPTPDVTKRDKEKADIVFKAFCNIADEMRVSTATVSTKLKEAGMNITAVVDA